jgi:alkaline phosphatase
MIGAFCLSLPLFAAPIKNVILMIPDGTSTSVLSLSRWCQWYKDKAKKALSVDPYIRGLVITHSSNALIGDSAPTSSWYATGEPSQTGFISMYPPKDAADLEEIDATRSYQPLMTLLEGARLSGKMSGIVVTCYFPHATPADFAAHWYDRQEYDRLAKQMVYNGIDLVFGGGTNYCTPELRASLERQGYAILFDDPQGFRKLEKGPCWALFGQNDMPFDLDRDPLKTPSLAEMTGKALNILSKSQVGFFLMVEGSRIDGAAHSNDPVGIYSEFSAFDRAVDTAMRFARNDSNTVVVVCPDHGTGAVSIGNRFSDEGYDKLPINQVCQPLVRCKLTAEGIAERLIQGFKKDTTFIRSRFELGAPGVVLSYPEIHEIGKAYGKFQKSATKDKDDLKKTIARIITARSFIGFNTYGHTGENVFFAAYDPRGIAPCGVLTGGEVNKYLCGALGLSDARGNGSLRDSTERYFARYPVKSGVVYRRVNRDTIIVWNKDSLKFLGRTVDKADSSLAGIENGDIVLRVKKRGLVYTIPAYKNYYYIEGTMKSLKTVIVWVDRNEAFYLPQDVINLLR